MNWTEYLHNIRKREVDIVFSLLPIKHFTTGLEIGAGDGFQTMLLAPHVDKLISSDLNFKRIKESLKLPTVEYKILDADSLEGIFTPNSFDFIFSSNVLEHVRNPLHVLRSTGPLLKDSGFAVHIVPSRHIKIFYLLFFYPNLIILAIDRILGKLRGRPFFQGTNVNLENNINAPLGGSTAKWRKFLFPSIHGNFATHMDEFRAFGKKNWEKMFIETQYSIIKYAKGPAFSGYGFGFEFLRRRLENLGISSEHIFILKKMSEFEISSWEYTRNYLPHGSFRDHKKFVKDWLKKEKSAKAFLDDFIKAVGNPAGKTVLDVGFGNGIIAKEFVTAGATIYGLETDDDLVTLSGDHNLYLYDGQKFPFDSNTFDYGYSTSVLEHMTYPQDVLKEIGRTLKPGGKFYLSFPNRFAPKETHTGLWFVSYLPHFKSKRLEDWNLHFISYFAMKRMARKAKLKIIFDTISNAQWKSNIKKFLSLFGIHYGILLKTIIVVLEKPRETK